MQVLASSSYSWTLFEDGGRCLLSVVCGSSALFTLDFELSPVEVQGYEERGDIALDRLASSVRLQPERYNQRRILGLTQLPEVKAVVAEWQSFQPIAAYRQNTGWHLLKVAAQGEPVVIGGRNVWTLAWQETEQEISVEHPDYPGQIHSLDVYELQTQEQTLMFAAGELSNNVWCFYLPDVY